MRMTKRRPDHISSIAHIFVSTSPASKPTAWTISKRKSVEILELFFGHATQSIPAGDNFATNFAKSFLNRASLFTKIMAQSIGCRICERMMAPVGSAPSSWWKFSGALTNAIREFSCMPNFLINGVCEYPAIFYSRHLLHLSEYQPELRRSSRATHLLRFY